MSELVKRLRELADDSGYHADFTAAANRITELEASLADAIEAQQVLGLKLTGRVFDAIDADHEANTVGGPTPVMDAAPACER